MAKLYKQTSGEGPELVMLHGWSAHSGIWANLLPELTKHYQITLIDLPGHGRSPLIRDYDIVTLAQTLVENTSKGATWLGWSLGGMIATYIAAIHPEHINTLITVATNPKYIAAPAGKASLKKISFTFEMT